MTTPDVIQIVTAGPQGPPGSLRLAGMVAYDPAHAYTGDEAVTYGGRVYVALVPSTGVTPDSDGTKWSLIDVAEYNATAAAISAATATAETFATGAVGTEASRAIAAEATRLNYRGAWAATTVYAANDAVAYNGGFYRALAGFTSGASFVLANWHEIVPQSGTNALLAGPNVLPKATLLKAAAIRAGIAPTSGQMFLGGNTRTLLSTGFQANPTLRCPSTGRAVLIYRKGVGDLPTSGAGHFEMIVSDDLGFTWSTPVTIYSDPGGNDVRDPMLTILRDGTWVVSFFKSRVADNIAIGVHTIVSSDQGATWSASRAVTFAWTHIIACSNAVTEPADGTWLLAGYGNNSGSTTDSHSIRSTDKGLTWSNEATILANGTIGASTNETVIGYLSDGSTLMALIRAETSPKQHYRSLSTDGGLTWAAATVAYAGGGRPTWELLASGNIVTVYRRDGVNGARPAVYRTSRDQGVTWSAESFIENSGFEFSYACPREVVPGLVALPYTLTDSRPSTNGFACTGRLRWRWMIDGAGVSPFGDLSNPRRVVTVVGPYTLDVGDDVVLADASSRQVTDGTVTSGRQTFVSLTAALAAGDVGRLISGNNVAAGTTLVAVPATTIAAPSNGLALPQATINVAAIGAMAASGQVLVTTDAGVQIVAYTGTTDTQLTGCTGGTGTMSTGGAVTQGLLSANATGTTTLMGTTIGGAFPVTLPPGFAGLRAVVKKTDSSANAVTIAPTSGTIDGAASLTLAAQYQGFGLSSDGTNWEVTDSPPAALVAAMGPAIAVLASTSVYTLTAAYATVTNARVPIAVSQLPSIPGKTLQVRLVASMTALTAADSVDLRITDDTGGTVLTTANFAAAGGEEWMTTPWVNAPASTSGWFVQARNNTAVRGQIRRAYVQTQYV